MTGRPGMPARPLMDLIEHRSAEAGMSRRAFLRDRFGDAADRNWWRWTNGQTIRRDIADHICIALGVHPTQIWPEWADPPQIGEAMQPDRTWQDEAACHGVDPDLFFPDSPHDVPAGAQAHCMTCPVFDTCFTYGLGQEHGVWANTSEDDRRRIRKARRITLAPAIHPLEEPA